MRCLHTIITRLLVLLKIEITDSVQIPFKSISFGACFSCIWQYFFAFSKLLYTVECNGDYLSAVHLNKGVRIGIYLYSHFAIWKKLIFWRTFIFARLIFAWSFIFADANFAIFCILRRFISKDVCSVIIVAKRQNRNLCKLSKELKLELRKVTLFMRDLSAANQTAIISFLRTFLFVFMIRLG